jgi:hypothetical protein
MTKGVKAYNKLMFHLGMEYDTIGTKYTEDPERRSDWNLRDLVSEVQYWLDFYLDPNSSYYENAHDPDDDGYKEVYKKDISMMRAFIRRYKKEALNMDCNYVHVSKYDNNGGQKDG